MGGFMPPDDYRRRGPLGGQVPPDRQQPRQRGLMYGMGGFQMPQMPGRQAYGNITPGGGSLPSVGPAQFGGFQMPQGPAPLGRLFGDRNPFLRY